MLRDLFIEPFNDGWWAILGVIVWVFSLFIAGFILYGCLYLIDSVGRPYQRGTGRIVNMVFHPARTYTTFVHVNKVSIPQVHHVPDSWECVIEVNGLQDGVNVTKYFYDRTAIGSSVDVTFTNGRIWDSLYIKNFKVI